MEERGDGDSRVVVGEFRTDDFMQRPFPGLIFRCQQERVH